MKNYTPQSLAAQHMSQGDWLGTMATYAAIIEAKVKDGNHSPKQIIAELQELQEMLVLTDAQADLMPKRPAEPDKPN